MQSWAEEYNFVRLTGRCKSCSLATRRGRREGEQCLERREWNATTSLFSPFWLNHMYSWIADTASTLEPKWHQFHIVLYYCKPSGEGREGCLEFCLCASVLCDAAAADSRARARNGSGRETTAVLPGLSSVLLRWLTAGKRNLWFYHVHRRVRLEHFSIVIYVVKYQLITKSGNSWRIFFFF